MGGGRGGALTSLAGKREIGGGGGQVFSVAVLAQAKARWEDLVFQLGETEKFKRSGRTVMGS